MNKAKALLILVPCALVLALVVVQTKPSMVADIPVAPSSIVDAENMINARGEHVDTLVMATLKIKGSDEIIEYREREDGEKYLSLPEYYDYNQNPVLSCIEFHCQTIYLIDDSFIESGKEIFALFTDLDKPYIGTIISTDVTKDGRNDTVTYRIVYGKNGNKVQTSYMEKLCSGVKGGGIYCRDANMYENIPVLFRINEDGKVHGFHPSGKIYEAQLVRYQFSTEPDTGEVFPVVEWASTT